MCGQQEPQNKALIHKLVWSLRMPRIDYSKVIDLLLINPDSSFSSYQGLATDYAAIEPPTWALLLASPVVQRDLASKSLTAQPNV